MFPDEDSQFDFDNLTLSNRKHIFVIETLLCTFQLSFQNPCEIGSIGQASRDPFAHGRVRLSLIRRLVYVECNYALWNVIIAQSYA